MQLFLLAWTGIGSVISFYLYETKQDVLLCEARPDSIKCFLFAEIDLSDGRIVLSEQLEGVEINHCGRNCHK